MNEILIHEGKRILVPWHRSCVLLDVNGEHIVLGHNGILRLQKEAMMDSSLSLLPAETNPEIINNIELLQRIFALFGLDGGRLSLFCDAFCDISLPFLPSVAAKQ